MKYIHLNGDLQVGAIIPAEDPIFPGIPIEERYTQEFLNSCVQVEDDVEITMEMKYNPETKEFYIPEPPEVVEPIPTPTPEESFTISEEEINKAYEEGVNNVE